MGLGVFGPYGLEFWVGAFRSTVQGSEFLSARFQRLEPISLITQLLPRKHGIQYTGVLQDYRGRPWAAPAYKLVDR